MITCTTLLFACISRKKSGKAKIFTFSTSNIERPSQFSMFNGAGYRERLQRSLKVKGLEIMILEYFIMIGLQTAAMLSELIQLRHSK